MNTQKGGAVSNAEGGVKFGGLRTEESSNLSIFQFSHLPYRVAERAPSTVPVGFGQNADWVADFVVEA